MAHWNQEVERIQTHNHFAQPSLENVLTLWPIRTTRIKSVQVVKVQEILLVLQTIQSIQSDIYHLSVHLFWPVRIKINIKRKEQQLELIIVTCGSYLRLEIQSFNLQKYSNNKV